MEVKILHPCLIDGDWRRRGEIVVVSEPVGVGLIRNRMAKAIATTPFNRRNLGVVKPDEVR